MSLIFPSPYFDSPSSMFGHTLLRFNKVNSNHILSLSFDYAATQNPNDGEPTFLCKGLVGGYPSDITILPYYMKLKEYKDMESRDIWEYQLYLSAEETIPVDTVRAAIDKSMLIGIHYRPSVKTKFKNSIKQLNTDQQEKIMKGA